MKTKKQKKNNSCCKCSMPIKYGFRYRGKWICKFCRYELATGKPYKKIKDPLKELIREKLEYLLIHGQDDSDIDKTLDEIMNHIDSYHPY